MLACVTGSVDEELLARNEYLVTENRILRNQILAIEQWHLSTLLRKTHD